MAKTSARRASASLYRVFGSEISGPVLADKGTDGAKNQYFGFPYKVLSQALEMGRAKFSREFSDPTYGKISAKNLVLFYSHCMMKGHLFAAITNFKRSRLLREIIKDADRVVVIDVGCGPATAGLAFAESFAGTSFEYHGVDMARAMRAKAEVIMNAAAKESLITKKTKVFTYRELDAVPDTFGSNAAIVLTFSFLFASKSLSSDQIKVVAAFHNQLVNNNPDSHVVIAYTNSVDSRAAKKYRKFLTRLKITYSDDPPTKCVAEYFKYKDRPDTNTTRFTHEVFEVIDA